MYRPEVNSGSDWLSDHVVPLSRFDRKLNSAEPPIGRFRQEANRRVPEVTVPISGSSLDVRRGCDRAYSSPQIPSSTVEIGLCDVNDVASYRRKLSTGSSGRGSFGSDRSDWNQLGGPWSSDWNQMGGPWSIEVDGVSRGTNADEDVSSSTSDSIANDSYLVRSRSVSLCTELSTIRKSEASTTASKPGVSNYSILESILLNRNVPPFYSSVGTDGNRRSSHSQTEVRGPNDCGYKRPRLRSLPLLSIIPPSNAFKAHSNQRSHVPYWLSSREEKPPCLAFKRRKVSLEGHSTSQNEISSLRHIGKDDLRESDSLKRPRNGSSNGSILHSLLTFESAHDDQNNHDQLVKMEVENQNLDGTVYHVDSTLEKLALGERARQLGVRQQRVAIAKKMQLVVNRKVRKWLIEIAQLAAKYRDLTGLPREDWLILLRNAVSRLLLLYMAESNFQFAVAPVATDVPPGEGDGGAPGVLAEIPTAGSVEDIQRFIAKCQTLKVDSKEYQCMRLITLFHSGCTSGIRRIGLVEQINSGACKVLHDLVLLSRPGDKLRYGELLLHLHSLASVNSRMVQRFFSITTHDARNGNYIQIDESQWLTLD